jgi:hypothetical protein
VSDLSVRVVNHGTQKDIECLCGEGKRYVEGEWPAHGWRFDAGQCCDCLNIFEIADVHDSIHVCDLDAFIHMLTEIRKAKLSTTTTASQSSPKESS